MYKLIWSFKGNLYFIKNEKNNYYRLMLLKRDAAGRKTKIATIVPIEFEQMYKKVYKAVEESPLTLNIEETIALAKALAYLNK